ncbi:MAG: hypothetical protein U0172_08260 [Nitrospiraceae bacterium]
MRPSRPVVVALCGFAAALLMSTSPVGAVDMQDDPKGFLNPPDTHYAWGSTLDDNPALKRTYTSPTISEYQLNDRPPQIDTIPVSTVKFSSLQGEFARVTVRYQGEATHKQLLAYLQRRYGPLDRTPGQMVRGLNQQFNWRGVDTEINLTYEGQSERGYIFFDSRTLAPRFNDGITDSSE